MTHCERDLSRYFLYCKSYSTKTRIVTLLLHLLVVSCNIAKAILLKQGLWRYVQVFDLIHRIIAKAILLKQGLWPFCFFSHFFTSFIAKAILLKQGLWLHIFTFCLWTIHIAKAILLKQGLWQQYVAIQVFVYLLQKLFY